MATLIWKPSIASQQEAKVITVADRTYTFEPGIPEQISVHDVAAVTTALKAIQGNMTSPAAPTVTNLGTPDSTSYTYRIAATGAGGDSQQGATTTTATGAAALNATDKNHIVWGAVAGAQSYKVIRSAGGATQGVIGTTSALTFDDTGLVATTFTNPGSQPPVASVGAGPTDA